MQNNENDDELIWADEEEDEEIAISLPKAGNEWLVNSKATSWKVMIVDDEILIHEVMRFALDKFVFQEKTLDLIFAKSSEEAKSLLQAHPDIALIFLDVVMEENDSGLKLVKYIRDSLKNQLVRIILHTGLPGEAPEESVIMDYDINDYKLKSEMTQSKMLVTTVAGLRAYCDLIRLEASQVALKQYQDHLEDLVAKRTAELNKTNVHLQNEIRTHKKTEDALKKANKYADSANRAKSEFLACMSHEFRIPMNAIIGFSDLLSKMVTDRKQKSYLDSIKTAGKTLLTLINDILDLAKIDAGRLEIKSEPIDQKAIFYELEQLFAIEMADKGLDFRLELEDNLPTALVLDKNRLRQALFHLIGNAVKFTDQGHITLSIRQCDSDRNVSDGVGSPRIRHNDTIDLIITVADTGIGIPFEQQNKIFEAFQQIDGQSTRKYGGTGLGLAITKRLVEMMNGRISLKSQVGMGSVFEITLRDVKVPEVAPAVKKDDSFEVSTISFEPARILIVDDIESNRDIIRENLSQVNLEVIEAEDGQKGLLIAQEYQPALILMDIRMPVMDGYEATKQLKQNPSTQKIPVIALTASVLGEPSKIKAHEFDGFLSKPVQISKLLSELSRYLEHTILAVKPETEEVEIDPLTNLTPSDKAIPPELMETLETLEKKFRYQWEELQGVFDMTEMEDFANDIKRLGEEYQVSYLTHYGQNLGEFIQDFDIELIEKALTRFLKFVNSLKFAQS